jgi:uncharacterized alkaline shock family protein YloU
MEEAHGAVVIDPQVITTVVRQVAETTPGVARLAAGLSKDMRHVFRRRRATRGVSVTSEDGAVTVDLFVVATPNTVLLPLGQTLQHQVQRALTDVVGVPVRAVNVHFTDVDDPLMSVEM